MNFARKFYPALKLQDERAGMTVEEHVAYVTTGFTKHFCTILTLIIASLTRSKFRAKWIYLFGKNLLNLEFLILILIFWNNLI